MNAAHNREQLNAMLCEAAEIEHSLMCTYLYAAFSLKQSTEEGISETELEVVRRWRGAILSVAIDEMLHLALVNNLIAAIGERPHYRRFNFPIGSGLFPADVAVSLAPLDLDTLDHFVYLERPRSVAERDAARYAKGTYHREVPPNRLMAFGDDYETVGELYEKILASFQQLVQRYGTDVVLVGAPDVQLTREQFALDGLHAITSLADVERAIERIVSQGEGSTESRSGSHYARFCAIRSEWQQMTAARPDFHPSRPAAYDPIMRSPVVNAARVHIIDEPAATLLDLGNAGYGLMLRLMAILNEAWLAPLQARTEIAAQSLALMHLVTHIGEVLTTLPANERAHPGVMAGLTFTVSRNALSFVSSDNACAVIAERLSDCANRLQQLSEHVPNAAKLQERLTQYSQQWKAWREALHTNASQTGSTPVITIVPVSASSTPAAIRDEAAPHIEIVKGTEATLRFDHKKCIHARHCVLGEPTVFLANTPGDWINPDAADRERLLRVALNCPSGAIRTTGPNDEWLEPNPNVNVLRVRENGPLAVHAQLQVGDAANLHRATLCRCGQSQNKPYCDGSHVTAAFQASGEPPTIESPALAVRNGALKITPLQNGPLECHGSLEILSGTGRTVERVTQTRLCRCGHSKNKPYCDRSHVAAGFQADGE